MTTNLPWLNDNDLPVARALCALRRPSNETLRRAAEGNDSARQRVARYLRDVGRILDDHVQRVEAARPAVVINPADKLPFVGIHKWTSQRYVILRQPDGTQRIVNLGSYSQPEVVAKRYREVVAEHLAEFFGRPPSGGTS